MHIQVRCGNCMPCAWIGLNLLAARGILHDDLLLPAKLQPWGQWLLFASECKKCKPFLRIHSSLLLPQSKPGCCYHEDKSGRAGPGARVGQPKPKVVANIRDLETEVPKKGVFSIPPTRFGSDSDPSPRVDLVAPDANTQLGLFEQITPNGLEDGDCDI